MRRYAVVDPKTGNFITRPSLPGNPLAPPPLLSRSGRMVQNFRGFGDVPPNQSGGQGSLIAPYDEETIFNPPAGGGPTGQAPVTTSTAATPNPATTGFLPPSAPYGESDRPWSNPTTFATVPISAVTTISLPVLSQNFLRNALIVQNGSTATAVGDVAPTLYVGFNAQPIIGSALALPPGVGVVFDIICPRDSIYIAFGPFSNGGGSVVIQGCVVGGTYAP